MELLGELEPKITGLSKVLLGIDLDRAKQPEGEPVVYIGSGSSGQVLKGVQAHLFLGHLTSLKTLLTKLMVNWGWSEFVSPEGSLDVGRLAISAEQLPRPTCESSDLALVESALTAFDLPGADLTYLTQEKISNIPPPTPRGPGSWQIPGTSPFLPGERVETSEESADLVAVIDIDEGANPQWLDITRCRKWPLDQPYGLTPVEVSAQASRLKVVRFEANAEWIGGNNYEFRFLIRSDDGRYLLLGAPSHQWYRDKLVTFDGMYLLLSIPQFHGEITLLRPDVRRLYLVTKEQAIAVLIHSGYSVELPNDLRSECLGGNIGSSDFQNVEFQPLSSDPVVPLDRRLSPCEAWIIESLQTSGRRMTKSELQGRAKVEGSHGASTVGNAAAKLNGNRIINSKRNDGDRGSGYGLQEWH